MPHRQGKADSFERLKIDRTITAAEATRHFGRVQEEVAGGPITLTHHGRARMVLLSQEDYETMGGGGAASAESRLDGAGVALEEMEEAFVALDDADRIVAVNRVAEFYIGQSRHELVGRHWADAMPPLASTRFPAILADVRALGRPQKFAWDSVVRERRRLQVNIFPIPDARGGVGILFADVGEIERQAERLALVEGMLEAIFAAMPEVAAVVFDAGGQVRAWRGAAASLFGWTEAEMEGRALDMLLVDPERDVGQVWAHLAEARRNGASRTACERRARSGETLSVDCATRFLPGEDLFVCIMRRIEA